MIDWLDRLNLLYGNDHILIHNLNRLNNSNLNFDHNFMSIGQIESKLWLIERLNYVLTEAKKEQTIFINAGWYGLLAALLFERATFPIKLIRSFDVDCDTVEVADLLNKQEVINSWRFKAICQNIHDIRYPHLYQAIKANGESVTLVDDPNIIINTSCEHINDFDRWFFYIPDNKLIVLQSNNLNIVDHINKVSSIEEFKKTAKMNYIYEGEKNIEKAEYTRYMLIGYK